MITWADLFGVSYIAPELNSNTFLDSSDCFVRLQKNSLPVSVVLTRRENLLVPDDRIGFFFEPCMASQKRLMKRTDTFTCKLQDPTKIHQ